MKAKLTSTLSKGKTRQVIEDLLPLSTFDPDLHDEAVALSARFQKYLREKNGGTKDVADLDIELNRINSALLDLIGRLPEGNPVEKKIRWKEVAVVIGILASIAGITGYTLKDVFWKKEATPIVQPTAQESKPAAPITQPKAPEKTAPSPAKNNVSIEVKDKAKVGTIITGDSNKIDINQEF